MIMNITRNVTLRKRGIVKILDNVKKLCLIPLEDLVPDKEQCEYNKITIEGINDKRLKLLQKIPSNQGKELMN